MAAIDRREYERRENAAARRMRENAEIDTLTLEQHEALERLCSIRHEFHGSMGMALYRSEYSDHDEASELISGYHGIYSELAEAGLDKVGIDLGEGMTWLDVPDDSYSPDRDDTEDEEKKQAIIDDELRTCYDVAERWNNSIENYLRQIDKKYGTNYCPSGAYRIY